MALTLSRMGSIAYIVDFLQKRRIVFPILAFVVLGTFGFGGNLFSQTVQGPKLTISNASVPFGGEVTLAWDISGPLARKATCTASGASDWNGPVRKASGTLILQPQPNVNIKTDKDTVRYSILCTGSSPVTASVILDRYSVNRPILSFYLNGSPDQFLYKGDVAHLKWSFMKSSGKGSARGVSCKLNGQTVGAAGSKDIVFKNDQEKFELVCPGRTATIANPNFSTQSIVPATLALQTLSSGTPITSIELGKKVQLRWDLMGVEQSNFKNCTVSSNGDYTSGNTTVLTMSGVTLVEPIRKNTSYFVTCTRKTGTTLSSSLKISVVYPQKPILREMSIDASQGTQAGKTQTIKFVLDNNSGSTMDCGQENSRLGNLTRSKNDWGYDDAMYSREEWPIRPAKSGRCVYTVYRDVAQKNSASEAVEFSVQGTLPPSPKQMSVSNIVKPSGAKGPGEIQTLSYTLGGYYMMSGNFSSVVDYLQGDVNCLKAFVSATISNGSGDSYKKNVLLTFKPGNSGKCRYEIRSRPTGKSETILFDLTVGPPDLPAIQNPFVLSPLGNQPGSIQYIDFIAKGEKWEVTPYSKQNDECSRPALVEASFDPNAPHGLAEYKDSSVAYYTHVSYPVTADKSITCIINVTSKNKKAQQKVYVDFVKKGSSAPVHIDITMKPDNVAPSAGLVGNSLNFLVSPGIAKIVSDYGAGLISNNSASLNTISPLSGVGISAR